MSLIIRKMQIKTTVRCQLTSIRMTTISKSKEKCWQGCGGRGTLLYSWRECIVTTTVESSMEIPQKIKNGSSFWPSDPTSGNISEGTQNTNSKEHKHTYVHCSVIYNCQDMEAVPVSINRWVDKTAMEHLHNGILLDCKKKEISLFMTV